MKKSFIHLFIFLPILSFAFNIGDKVWNDVNQDWVQNNGEVAYANVSIELYDGNQQKIRTTMSDVNGKYLFTNLPQGDYWVKLIAPNGVNVVSTNNVEVWLNQDRLDVDFGLTNEPIYVPSQNNSIKGVVWNDSNTNWLKEPKEYGLENIDVELYTLANVKLQTVKTDALGHYEFKNLDEDDYIVKVVLSDKVRLITDNNIELWVNHNYDNINFGLLEKSNGVKINEVLVANSNTNLDPDYKQFSDWIELYNGKNYEIDMSGYYLSDDRQALKKWSIPDGTKIAANSYLVIWADNEYDKQIALHTNFKISQKGERVLLSNEEGILIDSIEFPKQKVDISCAKVNNKIVYMNPTPNGVNSQSFSTNKRAKTPKFSLKSGFYGAVQTLELLQENAADIYYTTDGSIPSKNSKKYTQAIPVNKTMVVRARAYKEGRFVSSIANSSYFINENITLPVVSLAINNEYLHDETIGMYKNYTQEWIRTGSVEYFEEGKSKFRENVGIRIFGGQTRQYGQKSLAIFAKKKYGGKSIKYALFPDKPKIKKVKSFVLRNSGNDWGYTMMKDGMVHNIVKDKMDIDYQSYHPSVVFINGEYWGIYNIREKTNEDYLEANHGVDADKVDILAAKYEVKEGSNSDYKTLLYYIETHPLANNQHYNLVASKMDIDEYINYMIVEIYGGNVDWPYSNIKYWKEQSNNGKWRWILYDTDRTFENSERDSFNLVLDPNGANEPNPPWSTFLFRNLMKNDIFKEKFLTTFKTHLNSTFKAERIDAIIEEMKNRLKPEIQRHFAKWPRRDPSDWETGVDSIATLHEFAAERSATIKRLMLEYFNFN